MGVAKRNLNFNFLCEYALYLQIMLSSIANSFICRTVECRPRWTGYYVTDFCNAHNQHSTIL